MVRFFLLCVVFMLSTLNATTVLYQSFDDLVQKADGIVSGTVSEVNYRKKKGNIYTYVTLRDITVHSGLYDDSEFTFRMFGGTLGDRTVGIVGTPKFSIDDKVVLFISENGKRMIPIVGLEQGVFKINEFNSENYIVDANNNIVYDIDDKGQVHKIYKNKSDLHIFDENSDVPLKANTTSQSKKAMSKELFFHKLKEKSKNKKHNKKNIKNIVIDNDLILDTNKSNMSTSFSDSKNFKEDSNEI